jgi:hypothetical protein
MRHYLALSTRLSMVGALLLGIAAYASLGQASAAPGDVGSGNFSLLVTPSPLVTTLKPGTTTELELKVRNNGTAPEELKVEPRSFKFNSSTGQVSLNDTVPPDINTWISFANPTFKIDAGQWFTERVRFALPKDTGFSYSFALVISRKANPQPVAGTRLLNGSLAVFTLVNVDRPGATRQLEIPKFTATQGVYEYLPARFNIQFKNTGNSIVQPAGNVFIQRGSNDKTPIASLAVNDKKGYILPGSERTVTAAWNSGFPLYKYTTQTNGKETRSLQWNWNDAKLSNIRIGHYTAKLVAIYDDGTRDVPIQLEIKFWVIPWKILIGLFVVILILLFGLWTIVRKIIRIVRRVGNKRSGKKNPADKTDKPIEPPAS